MASCLVCLHGFTHTGASWGPVVRSLPRRYRVLAPDIRGHGSAAELRPASLAGVIGDVAGLAPAEFDLCGYSMGGRLALHVALAVGPRVKRLSLIGASPGLAEANERAARLRADEQLAKSIERMTIAQFARQWAETPVLAGLSEELVAAVDEDRRRNTTPGLAAALRGLGTGALPSLWERLSELEVPVTLIAGERDHKFVAIAKQMTGLIPDARLEVVPGAGHAVHLEAPDVVAAILSRRSAEG
ncbi:MAG TPA: 2-succinyl-6-hydroxy-2,4-cyclohexadiene-1-carboxylate synthase [Solirubrobacteraceae bacterium]|nr:2-succinyl-6-hydroxy-2,4-cyclohexadiene-1-carboxylate synthase [Solirubrobacteraceae bacterium]